MTPATKTTMMGLLMMAMIIICEQNNVAYTIYMCYTRGSYSTTFLRFPLWFRRYFCLFLFFTLAQFHTDGFGFTRWSLCRVWVLYQRSGNSARAKNAKNWFFTLEVLMLDFAARHSLRIHSICSRWLHINGRLISIRSFFDAMPVVVLCGGWGQCDCG